MSVEGRPKAISTLKGKRVESNRDLQYDTNTKLERIARLSRMDPQKKFACLMHLFNGTSLLECFHELKSKKARGTDGVSKNDYGQELYSNLRDLVVRMKRMAYHPSPARQVLIPKEGKPGAIRPLGISNFEDKLVQKMMQKVLESIYEPLFLNCSYGFRPGRSCHDAIRELNQHLSKHRVKTVIDVDLNNFFGTIEHHLLLEILKEKLSDKRLLRYLTRMFKAGVLSDGELKMSEEGVPQGSVCSPILANIFAHYVIDEWFNETVKKHCFGRQVEMFRYADDLVICCESEHDAKRIYKALKGRLEKFNLRLNEEKTKQVSFDKVAFKGGKKQDSFDFLGFTFYLALSRNGSFVLPKVKTSGVRLREKLKRVNRWCRSVRNKYRQRVIWKTFKSKLEGHIRYYAVTFNSRYVEKFVDRSRRILFNHLNRRSQRRSCNWLEFERYEKLFPLPKVKIYHKLF